MTIRPGASVVHSAIAVIIDSLGVGSKMHGFIKPRPITCLLISMAERFNDWGGARPGAGRGHIRMIPRHRLVAYLQQRVSRARVAELEGVGWLTVARSAANYGLVFPSPRYYGTGRRK